ncbi:unnamed protein product [Arctogadus glacialis]
MPRAGVCVGTDTVTEECVGVAGAGPKDRRKHSLGLQGDPPPTLSSPDTSSTQLLHHPPPNSSSTTTT